MIMIMIMILLLLLIIMIMIITIIILASLVNSSHQHVENNFGQRRPESMLGNDTRKAPRLTILGNEKPFRIRHDYPKCCPNP